MNPVLLPCQVRFNEAVYDEDEDAPSLEVLEVPPPVEQRPKTFDEQTALLAPADKEALFINRQSYASFPMVGYRAWGFRVELPHLLHPKPVNLQTL